MRSLSHHPVLSSPWLLWTLWVLGFALFSAVMPRDVSFDVIHYHLHNGWSGLNGRLDHDLAPAELHSFLNPTYNIGVWWLIEHLPGPAVSAVLGALQALVLPVLYYLSRRLFELMEMDKAPTIALFAAGIGFACAPMLAMLASVRNDWIGALAYCTALLLLLPKEGLDLRRVAIAALLVGLAAGMKLTNSIYVVAFASFVLMVSEGWAQRARYCAVAALTGLIGLALTGGPWMVTLLDEFGNPVFPLMNDVFGSPLGPEGTSRDTRYLPGGITEAVFKPLLAAFDLQQINESRGRDVRLAMAYAGGLAIVIVAAFSSRTGTRVPRPVLAFAAAQLVLLAVWVLQFSIMRYAMAAFLLGPTLFILAIAALRSSWSAWIATRPFLYGLALIVIGSTAPEFVMRTPWSGPTRQYVEVDRPDEFDYENAGVIMAGPYPTAFTSEAFPEAWITHGAVQEWSRPFLDNYRSRIDAKIASTEGPLYAVIGVPLMPDPERPGQGMDAGLITPQVIARLRSEYPVTGNADACRPLPTNLDTVSTSWEICPLRRTGQAVASRQDP